MLRSSSEAVEEDTDSFVILLDTLSAVCLPDGELMDCCCLCRCSGSPHPQFVLLMGVQILLPV